MNPPHRVMTDRLELRPMALDDVGALFTIFSDPAGWWYDPDGRHQDVDTTRRFVERAAARWERDGLSYWTVRRSETGTVIGLGGAQRQTSGNWNLNYRLAVAAQGQGYAIELGRAALTAAHDRDPHVPFIAWIAEHNEPSRRVAERLALTNFGPGLDHSDGRVRLAYADRPINPADLADRLINTAEVQHQEPGTDAPSAV